MRIGIDVTATITGNTGIARYVNELTDAMTALDDAPDLRRLAIGRARVAPGPATRHVRVPLRIVDRVWRSTGQPTVERVIGQIDSFHASGPVLAATRVPVVAVVHDLAALDHPDLHPARDVAQLRRYVDELDRVAAVIAVSETTADRLGAAGVAPSRVHVVPNGRTPLPEPVGSPLPPFSYVLAVGAPVPRKGFDVLLRAITRVDELDVVLVGPRGTVDDDLAKLAATLGIAHRVHRVGRVGDAELAGWYRDAAALVAPSVDEGFGLPLVEALVTGTPVVASDIAAFHEVTGGHATFVPVGDDDALADAIDAAAARSPDIMSGVRRGAEHAARYTWERCAAETLAVHRAVARAH